MENIIFNLPYIVKKINNNMINFSIVILSKNNKEKDDNFLKFFEEFINLGGDIQIIDINSSCEFLKIVDDISEKSINDKFSKDMRNIINSGDIYYDYNCDINYINTITRNDMILIIDSNYEIINFNITEIVKFINDGFDNINFNLNKNKYQPICQFYNKTKYTWINDKLTENLDENIKHIIIPDSSLKIDIKKEVYHKKILNEIAIDYFLNYENKDICYLFGAELFENNFYKSSYHEFNRYLSMEIDDIKRSQALIYIGDYYNKTGNENESLIFYNKAYLECSKLRLPLYKLGYHFYSKNDWNRCIFYTEGCLNIKKIEELEYTLEENFMYNDGPYSMLYVAYWWIGDIKKSKMYFDKAIEINPYNETYLNEIKFHYEYEGNKLQSYLKFQEIQYLYNQSKKYKSILEIYPESASSTHALLKGCNDLVTVITKNNDEKFIENIGNPGNIRILNMNTAEAVELLEIEKNKFDMIFINRNYDEIINDYSQYWSLFVWEKYANKLICGSEYQSHKDLIDSNFEISNIENDIWYKNISSLEKTIIYKKKKI